MSRTNHKPQFSTSPQLLRRAVTCMTVILMVITCAVLSAPVEALALQTSPSALSFTGTQGGVDPAAQSVTIWKQGDRERSWAASVSASWLTVSPMSGSISSEQDQVSVDVSLSSLPAGNHSSNVIITDVGPNGGTRRTVLPVSLTVSPPISTSSFNVSPPSLVFSGTAGGASPAAQTFAVSNTGSGTLSWAASDSAGWLVLNPMSGTNNGSVTANVNLTGLAAGTYNTAI
ncbi:MAG: BACON domain-containing protein, partial [Nitrospirales bacterium]